MKEIPQVIEEQEEQQFADGIDLPSKSTDAAVSPPTEPQIEWSKLEVGKIYCLAIL